MQVALALDPGDTRTLQTQIFEEFKSMIRDGKLKGGVAVPATRLLSEQLGVSRNTIIIAYEKLLDEGYFESRANVGTFVSSDLPDEVMCTGPCDCQTGESATAHVSNPAPNHPLTHKLTFKHATPLIADYWVGRTDPQFFPAREWSRIIESRLRNGVSNITHYSDPQGLPALRSAISEHIGPARGIAAEAQDIQITAGTQDGLSLVVHLLKDKIADFLHEDPCYLGARLVFEAAGYRCCGIPVDQDGICVDKLPTSRPAVLYITPSHQYPTGATLSIERRVLLLEWACKTGSVIIEDDYDGDFRYQGAPLTALRGLDRENRVIYLGTFSKSFGPGLRLGFAIASVPLVNAMRSWKQLSSNGMPWLEQATMAEFMETGGFRRHLRRIRAAYMKRRDTLMVELNQHFPGSEFHGVNAGIHLSWTVPGQDHFAPQLERYAALNQVGVYTPRNGGAWISTSNVRHANLLMMGYAATSESLISKSVGLLAKVVPLRRLPT